ncbi:hypothetical protein [Roseovarius aquimarinus]|uniref:Uncharacterized protein n=1 Tax=Roseovarius aquimarinus TaxID=1229156 RepID=A0ABW7I7D1_9RHOB
MKREASMDLLKSLAAQADAVEQSWSLSAGEVERRVLLFFNASDEAALHLAKAAHALGVPETLLVDWTRALPGCDAVGLAVRDDLKSVRLYTQYWNAVVQKVRGGADGPMLLYAGFKALPDSTIRLDRYIVLPGAARSEFMPQITDAMMDMGIDATLVEQAFTPLTPEACIFTRTEDVPGERRSWLATVRRAELKRDDVAAMLEPLARDSARSEIAAAAARRDLLHVAGGEDRTKGRFTSLYFDAGGVIPREFFKE